jgi:hypothetical protein
LSIHCLSIYEESHRLLGLLTEGDADNSEKPCEDGMGPEKIDVGDGRSCGASSSAAATPTFCVTVIFKGALEAALWIFGVLPSVPKTLNLLALIDFVSLILALVLELNTEPSDSFAFRSRRCPTVSDSRGFFTEK